MSQSGVICVDSGEITAQRLGAQQFGSRQYRPQGGAPRRAVRILCADRVQGAEGIQVEASAYVVDRCTHDQFGSAIARPPIGVDDGCSFPGEEFQDARPECVSTIEPMVLALL